MDAFVDTASAWITNERQRAAREREVGRAWLSLLVEGDPDTVGKGLVDLAKRTRSADIDLVPKLRRCAAAYMEEITRVALLRTMRSRSGINCGRDGGEDEGATICTAPY
jgi:hypothetical protein